MTDDSGQGFGEQLNMWISAYSIARAAMGHPMSDTEMVTALIAILAHVLTLHDDREYQAVALQRAHECLDMLMERQQPLETLQ